MATFIEQTFHIAGGYEITLTAKGASIVDTASGDPGTDEYTDQVMLEPTTSAEARELSVALRFAQRRIEAIWHEMRNVEDAGRPKKIST